MNITELVQAVNGFSDLDIEAMERDELVEVVRTTATARSKLDLVELRCARRRRELEATGHADSSTALFGRNGKRSSKSADQLDERSRVADDLPAFEDDLDSGDVSAEHLDSLAAARRNLDDAGRAEFDDHERELREHARTDSVDGFARRCRHLARRIIASRADNDAEELDRQRANASIRRWTDKTTGMCHTHAELDPVRDAALWAAIEAQLASLRQQDGNARTPWSQLKVNALIAALSGCPADNRNRHCGDHSDTDTVHHARRVPEISVVVDLDTLVSGLHDNGLCETENGIPLPVSTVRRMCCDADIIPIVLDGDGVPVDVGRSSRTATRAQRRGLRAIYRSCGHPDCTVAYSACKAHHIRWWWQHHGRTDLDNLIPLCEHHHHLVHEGRWQVTMNPDRSTIWTRPDGTVAFHGPAPGRRVA